MALDLSEFLDESEPSRCIVGRVVDSLEGQDKANLAGALAAPIKANPRGDGVRDQKIIDWLKARGLPGRKNSVHSHRTGACCCE